MRQNPGQNCDLADKIHKFNEISHILRKSAAMQLWQVFFGASRQLPAGRRPAIDKIVGKASGRLSACFALFGPKIRP
jgi:hypothetical protein